MTENTVEVNFYTCFFLCQLIVCRGLYPVIKGNSTQNSQAAMTDIVVLKLMMVEKMPSEKDVPFWPGELLFLHIVSCLPD